MIRNENLSSLAIECVDLHLGGLPGTAASYLLEENGAFGVIDTGAANSAPFVLAALSQRGRPPSAVQYVIITHVHLDHAGGAGTLMSHLPDATLIVHPRGLRHMEDPGQLWDGAVEVYGLDEAVRIFGRPDPTPSERIRAAADGAAIDLNGRPLDIIETLGHARHHFSIVDPRSDGIFPGDTFGSSYKEFNTTSGPFAFLASNPVQFDPAAWHNSIDVFVKAKPTRMFLTHFGMIDSYLQRIADDLRRCIDDYVQIARRCATCENRFDGISRALMQYTLNRLAQHGCNLPQDYCRRRFALDVMLSAKGLEIWIGKKSTP